MNKPTVLVTGASRGIGKSIATLFAAKGYYVFLNCRQSFAQLTEVWAELETQYPDSSEIVFGDVGNPDEVRAMFLQIEQSCNGLDVLINNAGISYIGLLSDMTDQSWQDVIQTNLSSSFYCCRAAVPYMVSQKKGKIINISSMWGTAGASCEAAYSASKSGLHGLTRALSKELAPSNIQVNAIACGAIDTSMNNQLSMDERRSLEDDIPVGRFGLPEEIAETAFYLASSHPYLTGQIIGIDGGFL